MLELRYLSGLPALAFLVTLMSGSEAVAANANECSHDDGVAAEAVTGYLDSWKNLHSAYKQFKQCDDGGIAEGFSEAVARLMADNWASLDRVLPLTYTDPAFEAWFVDHLDETDNNDDLVKIDHLAKVVCPAGARSLCHKIRDHLKSLGCSPHFPNGAGCLSFNG
jgi:hypothetical protein